MKATNPPTRAQVEFLRRLPQARKDWSKELAQKRTLWATCGRCGHQEMIAYGFVAQTMMTRRLLEILVKIGWRIAPKILCPKCK